MDTISLDDWEVLPGHRSSFLMDAAECRHGVGGCVKDQLWLGAELVVIDMDHFGPTSSSSSHSHPPPCDHCVLDEEAKQKPLLLPPSEDAYACECDGDRRIAIDAVPDEPERADLVSEATEVLIYEADEEEMAKSVEEADQDDDALLVGAAAPDGGGVSLSQCTPEEEEEEGVGKAGFGVGSLRLRVNGAGGALCSFGVAVAAATFCFCVFLIGGGGGKQQQQQQLLRKGQDPAPADVCPR
ncbi:uncharacterized protein LOC115208753 [Zea mays]|jgi:hypothetical protein|uniref:Uncharacterized protein n=1 Tax=Zea mays TaxID=4577 RepID=A0A1D6L8D9_MAIZE|nr:uncharacterized protein LOC115208753 [Zea mays]ONM10500.1 hypothetical protein ZEAMMB73_Zm00001d034526 [Zea mays]